MGIILIIHNNKNETIYFLLPSTPWRTHTLDCAAAAAAAAAAAVS